MVPQPVPNEAQEAVTLIDRFICLREGHKPMVTVTYTPGYVIAIPSYITTCQRCGKAFEVSASLPSPGQPPE